MTDLTPLRKELYFGNGIGPTEVGKGGRVKSRELSLTVYSKDKMGKIKSHLFTVSMVLKPSTKTIDLYVTSHSGAMRQKKEVLANVHRLVHAEVASKIEQAVGSERLKDWQVRARHPYLEDHFAEIGLARKFRIYNMQNELV